MKKKTRRDFVKDAGMFGGAFALYGCSTTGGGSGDGGNPPTESPTGPPTEPPTEPPETQPPFTGVRVRRSVSTLDPNGPELTAYRTAVTRMRALPANDRRSWLAQANIHRNSCPHNNWYFLPWHRAYLHRFEQICAEMSGVADFALPYWDWSTTPSIPSAFWGNGNPLNHSPRAISQGGEYDQGSIGLAVVNRILATTDTEVFMSSPSTGQQVPGGTGQFEGSPHNHIHGRTGGDMGGTATAALDPIFWLHHANVDRLWAAWTGQVFSQEDWLNFEFTNAFYDASGTAVRHSVASTLSTVGLGFRYEQPGSASRLVASTVPSTSGDGGFGFQAEVVAGPPPAVVAGSTTVRELTGGEVRIESLRTASTRIVPNAELRTLLAQRRAVPSPAAEFRLEARGAGAGDDPGVAALPGPAQNTGTPRLTIEGVEEPAQPATVRVFLNAPEATADTPVTDPHYVGSMSFFGADHADHAGAHAGLAYLFDLGPCLDRLEAAGLYSVATDALDVQLVIVPVDGQREGFETSMSAPNKISISYVQ